MRFNAYSALFSLTITSLVTSSSAYMHGVMKHHRARGLTDTCAYVNSGLSINAPSYGLQYFGLLQSCLCIADLGTFITSSTVAAEAVKVAGLTLTTTTISNLVRHAHIYPYSLMSCS
ncbi:hypothetical protein SISNIDRAFT_361692 [Sistotremastrum niveocremeum HHB9708]|uniref:Uncharacterized protein n=1 Tax=Sistotremastrum niveocremeum HHB9708 TaxID=1314777 RepID=A0A164WRY8_9AGAM|nr:hypothetical protein SISNIDRAFT_361692 [Sistotremastrum niveocremeum HHB9708]